MNFMQIDDNYVVNLDQVKYFHWHTGPEVDSLSVTISMGGKVRFSFFGQDAKDLYQRCQEKGVKVPKFEFKDD